MPGKDAAKKRAQAKADFIETRKQQKLREKDAKNLALPQNADQQKSGRVFSFPEDLAIAGSTIRPIVRFTCFERTGKSGGPTRHTVHFPCPPNIAFADNASYSSIDLGQIGAVQMAVQEGAQAGSGNIASNLMQGLSKNVDVGKLAADSLVSNIAPDVAERNRFAQKRIKNPNTNTTFGSVGIRTFSFSFKLVADSAKESQTADNIVSLFREMLYPTSTFDEQLTFLRYPPTWGIDFMTMVDGGLKRNPFLPMPFACYLTACNTTYNASANVFHDDGQPFEIDMTVNFQETRSLIRDDIQRLKSISIDVNGDPQAQAERGIAPTGLALTSQPDAFNYTPLAEPGEGE